MINNIKREKIDEDLYLVLRSIFHYERSIAMRYGLDFEEIYTLQHLRRNPAARVTDLSSELQLPMFTVSRLVNRLEKGGYLTKLQDDTDRRNIHLHLEQSGENVLREIEKGSYERITGNLASLEEGEINELLHLAERLHMVLGVTENVIK
jgi:MarR family transcriptional regulator, organic hydroperoxide resistance regulator